MDFSYIAKIAVYGEQAVIDDNKCSYYFIIIIIINICELYTAGSQIRL